MTLVLDTAADFTKNPEGTSLSGSYTVGSLYPMRGLYAAISIRGEVSDPPTTISCTYNSVSMTKAGEITGSEGLLVALFYLANPSTGSNTLAFSWSGNALGSAYAISFYGVHPSDPILSGSFTSAAYSSTTSVSLSVPSVSGDVCIDILAMALALGVGETVTIGANQSSIINGEQQNIVHIHYAGSAENATSTSTTMSWTWTNSIGRIGAAFTIHAAPEQAGGVSISPTMIF